MSTESESVSKPRFVLCPKCWQLLQEAPNLDLYKCGGCGTTLQAKKRKNKAANSESSSNEIDAAPRNASDLSAQENVLREKSTSSSSANCSSEGNEGRNQIQSSECNGEKPVTIRENGLRETTFSSSGECSSEGNTERGQIENGDYNEEQPDISQENGLREKETSPSSGECSSDGNRERDGNSERGQIENGECDEEQLGPLNLSDEEPENAMDINKLSDIRRRAVSNEGCSNELPQCDIEAPAESMADNSVEKVNETNLKLEEQSNGSMPLEGAGNRLVSALEREDASDEISDLVEVKSEADISESDLEVAGEFNNGNSSQGADQKLIFGSDEQCVDNEKFALVGESLAKDVDETDKEDSKELQRTEVDTGGNAFTAKKLSTECIESEKRSILCVSPRELKVGTSDNHASSPENIRHSFDHVMSADTFDDTEVNNLGLKISGSPGDLTKSPTTRSSHAYDGSVSSNDGTNERSLGQNLYSFEGGSRKGKSVVVNSMVYEDVQTQYQNEVLETIRHDHAHRMRTRKDEFPFKMPLHGNFSQSGYESGSPSNQIYDELYLSSSYVSPDSVEDPDQEKMKLLRMVYKLQDQLNRTRETYERPSVVSRNSSLQSHDFHEGRFYHGLDYPSEDANSSYNHGINMHQRRHNFLGIPPGNAHYVDHPSFNCYPQEQQRFGNFPPHFPYQREDLYRPHPAHSRVLSQHSYPSSPQRLMTKHVHGRETKSCDQRYRAPEMNYTREKPNVAKRHYRPVAGGAPFITCLKCLNLLQLPADFLLFKRVCHKLKCGACQEVLKFSIQNRTHIVSYAPNTIDPVSYSDDYGRSVSKSYSSEGDPVSVAPFHHSHSGARGNPRVSPTTVEAITENEKKIIASRGPSTSKTTSSKSSEIEESQSQPKASALHQLMGYSSPSLVIRGASSSAEGKKAMLSGEY
ncbi:protein ENHANCED DISEASE RESISTANCE 4-like [Vicia villosa]|uniref:protein ENHANCED DISEASE RESISTANCE 4-like n=1 Tax=Vicia villosa TaxID=3911 RepID=UPI00273C3B63|nr:protein ENHANCED DISEASE RESISTANCE 4-like [Vicia villosa]XP_058761252.1 protein ENHANCED DISEASE RESISTANCE 4-like [Vicia villosa]